MANHRARPLSLSSTVRSGSLFPSPGRGGPGRTTPPVFRVALPSCRPATPNRRAPPALLLPALWLAAHLRPRPRAVRMRPCRPSDRALLLLSPPEACSPDHARPRRRRPGLLRLLAPPPDAGAPGSRDASAVPWRGGALEKVVLQPIREISGAVQLPGSKSLSNRILLLSALFEGTTVVDNLLNSEDVHYMLKALDALGLSVEADKVAKRAVVVGCGGRFPIEKDAKEEVKLFLGNAGTAMRPLTAAVVAAGGNATLVAAPKTAGSRVGGCW
ncbi:uncharacterized protein [Lolium perenne]|uniref:uncharacterized protein n=1 Tax=Lolium perenne TaxID=4522 RepID=UPI003A9973F8